MDTVEDLPALERSLGPFGYQWLSACAHLDLHDPSITKEVGDALARHLRTDMALDFDECAAFFTLPWLRAGAIPLAARRVLAHSITPSVRAITQTVAGPHFDAPPSEKDQNLDL